MDSLDELWTSFFVKNYAILDQLFTLDRASEYSSELVCEMRDTISFSKGVANRYRDGTSVYIDSSVHGEQSAINRTAFRD